MRALVVLGVGAAGVLVVRALVVLREGCRSARYDGSCTMYKHTDVPPSASELTTVFNMTK